MGPRIAKQDLALDEVISRHTPGARSGGSVTWPSLHRQTHSGGAQPQPSCALSDSSSLPEAPSCTWSIRWGERHGRLRERWRSGEDFDISRACITQQSASLTQAAERLCIWTPQDENKVGLGVAELRMRQAMLRSAHHR